MLFLFLSQFVKNHGSVRGKINSTKDKGVLSGRKNENI